MTTTITKIRRGTFDTKFAVFEDTPEPEPSYRYALGRYWGDEPLQKAKEIMDHNIIGFVGLNPSTASHLEDDQTIKKLTFWAKKWGYDGLVIVNVCAFRARNPTNMMNAPDSMGPDNVLMIATWMDRCKDHVFMWGNNVKNPMLAGIDHHISRIIERYPKAKCFGISNSGQPVHPLMLPYSTELIPYKAPK